MTTRMPITPEQEAYHRWAVATLRQWLPGLTITRVFDTGRGYSLGLDDLRDTGIWSYSLVPHDAAVWRWGRESHEWPIDSRLRGAVVRDVSLGEGQSTDLDVGPHGILRFALEHTGYEQAVIEGTSTFGDKRMVVLF